MGWEWVKWAIASTVLAFVFLLACPAATAAGGAGAIPTSGAVAVVTATEQPVGDAGICDRLERLLAQAAEELGRWRERLDE